MDKSGGNPSKSTKKDQSHRQDYTKKLTTESFLKLILFAQLHEVESLHALGDCLFDNELQKGIDLESISISQLSR